MKPVFLRAGGRLTPTSPSNGLVGDEEMRGKNSLDPVVRGCRNERVSHGASSYVM